MKIIFSRKGFDSSAGGFPSPIVNGRPISLPIPTQGRSVTTYGKLGLGKIVEQVTKGKLNSSSFCHHDPMFEGGRCAFGQTSASQTHLQNQNVTVGDVFLFFGLFSDEDGRNRHHRIFGYLEIESVNALGAKPSENDQPIGFKHRHPHTLGEWDQNNTIYVGQGSVASSASSELRLTRIGELASSWRVPHWLRKAGLTYHGRPDRWDRDGTLRAVGRGQEFVSNITDIPDAANWLESIKASIRGGDRDEVPVHS